MKVSRLLEIAEKLNEAIKGEDLKLSVNSIVIDSKDEIKALAEQEGAYYHEPTPSLPYYWSSVTLGEIAFQIETTPVEFELKIKE